MWVHFCRILVLTMCIGVSSVSVKKPTNRQLATPGELPYLVYITTVKRNCTGSLLSDKWVLTAATCFYDEHGKIIDISTVKVTAGIINTLDMETATRQEGELEKLVIHPSFWWHRFGKFDLALILCRTAFNLKSKGVAKIEVVAEPWPEMQKLNCTAAGYHNLGQADKSHSLNVIYPQAAYGELCPCMKSFQWKRMVCAGLTYGLGICDDDVGGPLVCNNKLVGVAHMLIDKYSCNHLSTDIKTGDCGGPRVIAIYMYTCPFLQWLGDYVPGLPYPPTTCKASFTQSHVKLFLVSVVVLMYRLTCGV